MKTERTYHYLLKAEHFIAAANKVFRRAKHSMPFHIACEIAATQPAPQFYVSPRHVLEQYNAYKRTGKISSDIPLVVKMYHDIFDLYEKRMAELGEKGFKQYVIQDVLDGPAPQFYISKKSALKFYYRGKADLRQQNRTK